jgi:hypothetical protein
MATHYDIQELTKGLRIRSSRGFEMWERLLTAAAAGIFVAGVTSGLLRGWWLLLSLVVAVTVFIAVKAKSAQLLVSNVEFTATGDIGRRVRQRVVNTADVRRLEFWQANGPFRSGPDGLYAVTNHGSKCLLPYLDYAQTAKVIRVIEEKFLGLAQHWRAESPRSTLGQKRAR